MTMLAAQEAKFPGLSKSSVVSNDSSKLGVAALLKEDGGNLASSQYQSMHCCTDLRISLRNPRIGIGTGSPPAPFDKGLELPHFADLGCGRLGFPPAPESDDEESLRVSS